MKVDFYKRKYVLILGAGASKEYGLPVWKDLDYLIRKKIEGDNLYNYGKDITSWMDKVGDKKEYNTIDECIAKESVNEKYHTNGDEIEKQIFEIMKDIFNEKYKDNNLGWINTLNDKILRSSNKTIGDQISFINYNYDIVLEKNFLDFEYLPGKYRRLNYKPRLDQLSELTCPVLYPHGNVYPEFEKPVGSNTYLYSKTMKTGADGYITDAVSCYESDDHLISHNYVPNINLYILGLGGGMYLNLSKLTFDTPISEIHVTIRDENKKMEVIEFLTNKFKIPAAQIVTYKTCYDLIDKCF